MNRRIGNVLAVCLTAGVLYYAVPFVVAVASLGELCPYSPAGTGFCAGHRSTQKVASVTLKSIPETVRHPVAGSLCKREGIRYVGATAQGAGVCFTLARSRRTWLEIGFEFVEASDCPRSATGRTYLAGPAPLGRSGRIRRPDFSAVIREETAAGVLGEPDICGDKTFEWRARRQPVRR
jgi:hypothetical protein